jgi:hypothetical protein
MGWPRCSLGPPQLSIFGGGEPRSPTGQRDWGRCIRHRKGPNFATSSQKAVPPMAVGASETYSMAIFIFDNVCTNLQ